MARLPGGSGAVLLRMLAVAAVVFLLSGLFIGGAQPVAVGLIPSPWDKLVHTAVFMALTLALMLAAGAPLQWRGGLRLPAGRGVLWGSTLLALLAGAADELHQAWFLPGRQAGWDDWLADGLGVALVAAWVLLSRRHGAAAPATNRR